MKLEELKKAGIVNGIGGKGGFNISLFIKNNIEQFKEYIPEKGEKFVEDVEELSIPHDVSYYNGNTVLKKIKADYDFAFGVMKKLWWTTIFKRLFVFSIIFLILIIKGNQFFNWGSKNYITYDK